MIKTIFEEVMLSIQLFQMIGLSLRFLEKVVEFAGREA